MNLESKQIQQLRDKYKVSLPEKAAVVTGHMHSLLDHKEPSQLFETIREDVHKLAGSLGMYGYDELSAVARQVMRTIDDDNLSGLEHELLNLRNLLQAKAEN